MDKTNSDLGNQLSPSDRVRKIKAEIEDLKNRMPAHSIPPSMFQQLEELEEELENELRNSQS